MAKCDGEYVRLETFSFFEVKEGFVYSFMNDSEEDVFMQFSKEPFEHAVEK